MANNVGALTLALRNAQSSLLANQTALDAVSQNIANANTEGYSRKVVSMENRVVGSAGAGVRVGEIERKVDEELLRSLRGELSTKGKLDAQTEYYDRIQDLFGSPGENTSLAHTISEFTAALESLNASPEKSLDQGELVRQAKLMTEKFNTMSADLQDLRELTEQEITDTTERVNKLIDELGDLNAKVVRNDAVGNDITDLQDQRDQKLNELSKYMDITYFRRSDGTVSVFTQDGKTLVSHIPTEVTHVQTFSTTATSSHAGGDIAGIYVGQVADENDITTEMRDGKLKGLVDMRDEILPGLQAQLDELASEIRDAFNQIHNRGTAFPGAQSMEGTRRFVDSATSTIEFTSGDTTLALVDDNGDQHAATTVDTIMQSGAYGSGAQAAGGPWTIDEVAATIEDWLQGNGTGGATVSKNTDNKFDIDLNSTTYSLVMRDEAATANGSTHQDATIAFDRDGGGTDEETVSGFSNFFGFNDFFHDNLPDNVWESDILDSDYAITGANSITITDTGGSSWTIGTINPGDSLEDVAAKINDIPSIDVKASVVPEGAGNRLRIVHESGLDFHIAQNTGTMLSDLDVHVADTRTASSIFVREDIVSTPAKVAAGALQWDGDKGLNGEYYTSIADETTANQLAEAFTSNNSFDEAGGLSNLNTRFESYASAIVGHSANLASKNDADAEYQNTLTESLKFKAETISGVNLDEEMSQLILFEQAYGAAARVISVIKEMFEKLETAV